MLGELKVRFSNYILQHKYRVLCVNDCPTNSQLLISVILTTVVATTVIYPCLSFWVLSDTLTRKLLLAELGTVGMRFSSSLAVKGSVHPSKRGTGGRSSVR